MEKLDREEFSAKYCVNALELKRGGSDVERLGTTLYNSKITLTPHQIQAALFSFKSPINKGVILADEVGLGKTIEAGIVIAQTWFEKKGKVIIVAPASLLKQWQNELMDKFSLDSIIIDRKTFTFYAKKGYPNPLKAIKTNIMIFSYQMCSSLKENIREMNFDLAVVDEVHKLRNVHNEKSITANNVKHAIFPFKKVLLTATPIQNNLMDIYGLCSVIDDEIFGDKSVFRYNYIRNYYENAEELEHRLKNVLHRTLRNQVQQYIQFTNRIPKTFSFELSSQEEEVYNRIRQLLLGSNEESYLIPNSQKHLLVLILCKLMGSSMHSIVFTLQKMLNRLERIKVNGEVEELDFEEYEVDEFEYEEEELVTETKPINLVRLNEEIENLEEIIKIAGNVSEESKFIALIDALNFSFSHLEKLGAEKKVLIFTESRRTQDYLYTALKEKGYSKVLLYNGSNAGVESQQIYDEWIGKHPESQLQSKSLNMKSAIIDKFKDDGQILIATEAGAEGLNLQFCSLVINYDLPWNPQRVEQRIGRCHRFGQKFDVVVINFISKNNVVEQRIYELLSSKFRLFEEVFGSSDSVLGTLEEGKDLDKAIIDIYSNCRTTEEINSAFDSLQEKYKEEITESMKKTKEQLLNYFEEDVQQYFKDVLTATEISISNIERLLWRLLNSLWSQRITVDKSNPYAFSLDGYKYALSSRNGSNKMINFNPSSQKGLELINDAKSIDIREGHVEFDITNYPYKLSNVSNLFGENGYISLNKVSISSFENEEHLVFNGILSNGKRLPSELCEQLFRLDTREYKTSIEKNALTDTLSKDVNVNIQSIINESQQRNNKYLSDEIEKINSWADDRILSVQLDVENMRAQRKDLQQQSDLATNMREKEKIEEEIVKLSNRIKQRWLQLALDEEKVEEERKNMISAIRKENMKETKVENLFTISFKVI